MIKVAVIGAGSLGFTRRLMHDILGRRRGWGTQGDPAYADVLRSLSDQLRQHMEDSNDRLLAGPVPHVAQHLAWERGTIAPDDHG